MHKAPIYQGLTKVNIASTEKRKEKWLLYMEKGERKLLILIVGGMVVLFHINLWTKLLSKQR